jgi:hypothetical protein
MVMNALELADSRKEWANDLLSLNKWSVDAEAMLRQKQNEIELLETEIFVKDAIKKSYKEALKQIATGEITNESNNYKDKVYVMRQIALNVLAILRKASEK